MLNSAAGEQKYIKVNKRYIVSILYQKHCFVEEQKHNWLLTPLSAAISIAQDWERWISCLYAGTTDELFLLEFEQNSSE